MELLAESAHQKGLECICHLHPDLPPAVRGDEVRLRQVLTNLVGNAIKFTLQGEISLSLEPASGCTAERPGILFTVRDTGIGIAEDVLSQLFKPFHQADSTHARRFGGTGLGLAIVRQLAELMDGQVDVSSTPGQGSTFRFTVFFGQALFIPLPLDLSRELQGLRILVCG